MQKDTRVLIVEDDTLVGRMIQRVVEDIGGVVVGRAANGLQAVEMARDLRSDVILMDIDLPGIDGIEASRRIQEHCPTPVVVLTTYETPELLEQASVAGVGAYLVKPPRSREMERAITITLARFGDMVKLRRLNAELQTEIAERRRAEEQLQRYAAELEEINEELKNFAYIVSHDLRTPLANIKGFSDVLGSMIEESNSIIDKCLPHLDGTERAKLIAALREDVPEALRTIASSVNRMDGLIGAILRLAHLGRQALDPEPIDMNALVRSLLRSMVHQIEQSGVRVKVGTLEAPGASEEPSDWALPPVVADIVAMEQIMGNLLDNAVKYLQPGRPGEIEITAERGPGEITFHIRDNGRGMKKEDIPRAFEIFSRVGKQDVPGEGMGLAYVRTLLRRHGGRIWCESEPGVGTIFSFTIPEIQVGD
jgi:signal transduction histidine kinase